MTRRAFIQECFKSFKLALVINAGSACAGGGSPTLPKTSKPIFDPIHGPSMREIARRKLHHANGRYINPFTNAQYGRMWRVLKWKLFGSNQFTGLYARENVRPLKIDWSLIEKDRDLSVTFIKHASILIKDQGSYLLVDPVFDDMLWGIKDFTPLGDELQRLPAPGHILITHGHYDHLNTAALARFDADTHVISPLGYNQMFGELGLVRRDQLDWYDTFVEGQREITLLPTSHWTMRNPLRGPNRSLWGAYLVKTAAGPTIWVGSDTAYFEGFSELGRQYDIDLAIFNLGAYEPRWFMAQSHMNPAEAVKAFKSLGAKRLMIVHWGTFRLGDEPVYLPPVQLKQELAKAGMLDRYIELGHGQTLLCQKVL